MVAYSYKIKPPKPESKFSNMFVIFIPKIWGRWTQFDEHIFSNGLLQPWGKLSSASSDSLGFPSRKQGTRRNLPTPSESKRWNDTLKRKSGFKGTWKLPPANRASSDCFFCWWVIWGENPKSAICHYVSGCKKMVVSELLQAMNYVSNQDFKYNKFTKSLE